MAEIILPEKISVIRVKTQDGAISEEIPIVTTADNVDVNEISLKDFLLKKNETEYYSVDEITSVVDSLKNTISTQEIDELFSQN